MSGLKMIKTGLFATLVLLMGCGGDDTSDGKKGSSMSGRRGGQRNTAAIPVQVASVRRGDISTYLLHTTTIEAEKQVDVLAKVSGQVVKLPAEEGNKVRRGATLAQLDEAELKIALLQSKAKMEADLSAYERAKSMLDKELIARENYDMARAQYENSKAAWEADKLRVAYTRVSSPITGTVTQRHIELGQRVNLNQVLFSIADFDPLRAKIYLPEKDMARVYAGQEARVNIDALPGMEFAGKVKMISPIVDPTNGTIKVTIDIHDKSGKLKPGMFASVYMTTESRERTLLIPKKALLLESETPQVYVFNEGIAKKAVLTTGFVSGDTIEVISGLKVGDQVVTVGQDGLREGLPIRVPGVENSMAANGTAKGKKASGSARSKKAQRDTEKPVETLKSLTKDELEMVDRMEKKYRESRFGKRGWERQVSEDPDFETNPAKKMAFFKRSVERMENMIFQRVPEAVDEWEKRVKDDPSLKENLEKKYEFLGEQMRNMRRGR